MIKPYLLRIMAPGRTEDILDDIDSAMPFGAIAIGDLLNLEEYQRASGDRGVLRVVAIEHQPYSGDKHFHHVIRIFTEKVEDVQAARLGGRT